MVNPAITAALIAASRQEEVAKIEGRLKKLGARSRGSAVALELTGKEQEALDQALDGGTVRRMDDGRLYLNERIVADRGEGQNFMGLLILLAIASVMASVVVLVARAGG